MTRWNCSSGVRRSRASTRWSSGRAIANSTSWNRCRTGSEMVQRRVTPWWDGFAIRPGYCGRIANPSYHGVTPPVSCKTRSAVRCSGRMGTHMAGNRDTLFRLPVPGFFGALLLRLLRRSRPNQRFRRARRAAARPLPRPATAAAAAPPSRWRCASSPAITTTRVARVLRVRRRRHRSRCRRGHTSSSRTTNERLPNVTGRRLPHALDTRVAVRPADQQQVVLLQVLRGHVAVGLDRHGDVGMPSADRLLQRLGRLAVGRHLVGGAVDDQRRVQLGVERRHGERPGLVAHRVGQPRVG